MSLVRKRKKRKQSRVSTYLRLGRGGKKGESADGAAAETGRKKRMSRQNASWLCSAVHGKEERVRFFICWGKGGREKKTESGRSR